MRTPQFVGLGVAAVVTLSVDLPLDWLIPLAILCGGVATYAATFVMGERR